ncbi:MAG: DUF2851 family protein [Flavobacteriaceae bacterium]
MKESFLHYIWSHQKFFNRNFQTQNGVSLAILHPGVPNPNQGPDFLDAKIYLDGLYWSGSVELHVNASDWYRHGHQKDSNYEGVVLHVVWNFDIDVCYPNGNAIPTLELADYVQKDLLDQYQNRFDQLPNFISCEQHISQFSAVDWLGWQDRLFVERMESRLISIHELLKKFHNDWEAVLFVFLAKGFGLNLNGETFYEMALQIPIKCIRQLHIKTEDLEALFMGQLGLLNSPLEDAYQKNLFHRYDYLKAKFHLKTFRSIPVKFGRLRPSNFPTIRLAQLAQLYSRNSSLFQSMVNCLSLDEAFELFRVQASSYWDQHFNFGVLGKIQPKVITRTFFNLIVINTLLPIRFAYQSYLGKDGAQDLFEWATQIPSEHNRILDSFTKLGVPIINASSSQSLIHLFKNYCSNRKCLNCRVGFQLMKCN